MYLFSKIKRMETLFAYRKDKNLNNYFGEVFDAQNFSIENFSIIEEKIQ